MNEIPEVVFSNSLTPADWTGTTIAGGESPSAAASRTSSPPRRGAVIMHDRDADALGRATNLRRSSRRPCRA